MEIVRAHMRLARNPKPETIKALHELIKVAAKQMFNYDGPIEVTECRPGYKKEFGGNYGKGNISNYKGGASNDISQETKTIDGVIKNHYKKKKKKP